MTKQKNHDWYQFIGSPSNLNITAYFNACGVKEDVARQDFYYAKKIIQLPVKTQERMIIAKAIAASSAVLSIGAISVFPMMPYFSIAFTLILWCGATVALKTAKNIQSSYEDKAIKALITSKAHEYVEARKTDPKARPEYFLTNRKMIND